MSSTHSPVIFSAIPSCEDGHQNLSFHELSTSIQLLQLKPTPSSSFSSSTLNPQSLPPRKSTVILPSMNSLGSTLISIAGKDGRNGLMVWTSLHQKPTPTLKLIPPGRVICISLSPSGTYLAAGSLDGTVLIWELSTGTLLASFDAHYKSITCLQFTDDDAALVTASEDSMCSVWSLAALIDEGGNGNMSYSPYVLLSDHTLPISDLHVSHGTFPDIRIFTASLDQTVKIWTPLYPSCPLLSTFAVPGPAHHLAVDPLERFIFVSYPITTPSSDHASTQNLQSEIPNPSLKSSASTYSASTVRVIPLFSKPSHAASQGGTSLVHSSNGYLHQASLTDSSDSSYTTPKDTSITALHLPSSICSSPMLLCGLSNGKIIHLSIPSFQPIGTTVPRSGSTHSFEPVVHISVFLRPIDLMMNYSGQTSGMASSGMSHSSSTQHMISPRVVGMLGRIVGRNGEMSRIQSNPVENSNQVIMKDRIVMIKLGRHPNGVENDRFEEAEEEGGFGLSGLNSNRRSLRDSNRLEIGNERNQIERIDRLQEEYDEIKVRLGEALRLNEVMWNGIVEGTLKIK
ncbi:WD40-repeat-containing domain protein [Melampsora americana]|nr:WD40-repeat-containing domain protein [Melampsora americana]